MVDEKWSARFRTHDEIRSHGAIGNVNDGVEITTHGVRTRLIAWPGNGFQTESVHVLTLAPRNGVRALGWSKTENAAEIGAVRVCLDPPTHRRT